MFAILLVFKGYTPNFTLQEDDIRAIQALYGTRRCMMFDLKRFFCFSV